METDKLIEIIKAAHMLGAKRIIIDGSKIEIDWAERNQELIVQQFPNDTKIVIPELPPTPIEPVSPSIGLYQAPFPHTTASYTRCESEPEPFEPWPPDSHRFSSFYKME